MNESQEKDSVLGVAILINRGVTLIEALSSHDYGKPSGSAVHSLLVIAEKLESLDLIVRPSPALLRGSLLAANNIRCYIEDAERGELEDHRGLAASTAKSADTILRFYGLTEADLPKEKGRWIARPQ